MEIRKVSQRSTLAIRETTCNRLFAYAEEHGLQPCGQMYEFYVNDPDEGAPGHRAGGLPVPGGA